MHVWYVVSLLVAITASGVQCGRSTTRPEPIALLDLGYTLAGDWNDTQAVKLAWDHAHTLATLQGLVNRDSRRLYTYFVKSNEHDIDRYWWDMYRTEGKWLAGMDTLVYPDIVSLIAAFKNDIDGVVVYDPEVPATSNVASA